MSGAGGNYGEINDGDSESLWEQIAPDWVKSLEALGKEFKDLGSGTGKTVAAAAATLIAFAEDPVGFVRTQLLEVVVGAILSAWSIFFDLYDDMLEELISIPEDAIFQPLADVVIAVIGVGEGVATSMLTNVEAELETFGLFAPFAPLLALLVTTVTFVAIGVVLWRITETYLPIEAVTDSLKVAVESVLALVPGGNNE